MREYYEKEIECYLDRRDIVLFERTIEYRERVCNERVCVMMREEIGFVMKEKDRENNMRESATYHMSKSFTCPILFSGVGPVPHSFEKLFSLSPPSNVFGLCNSFLINGRSASC